MYIVSNLYFPLKNVYPAYDELPRLVSECKICRRQPEYWSKLNVQSIGNPAACIDSQCISNYYVALSKGALFFCAVAILPCCPQCVTVT